MLDNAILHQIADMNLTELKKKRVENRMQEFLKMVDEFDTYTLKLQKVIPAYENIKEFGVTDSICDTYKDTLWTELEYDVTPFLNVPYAQLEYCIEGLGSVIRKIYQVLRNIIWKIKDFFLVDGFPAAWFDACERKKSSVEKLKVAIATNYKSFDDRQFMAAMMKNYEFPIFEKRCSALKVIIASLKSVTANADQKALWNGFFSTNKNQFDTLGITVQNYRVALNPDPLKRLDTAQNLGWYANNTDIMGGRVLELLKQGLDVKTKMYMFERMIIKSERNISDVLTGKKEPEVIRDEDTIKCIRAYAQTSDIIYNLLKDVGACWESVAKLFLSCCTSYKPGIFE